MQLLTPLTPVAGRSSNACWRKHAAELPCNMPASGLKLLAFQVVVIELGSLGSLDKTPKLNDNDCQAPAIAARCLQLEHSLQLICCALASKACLP